MSGRRRKALARQFAAEQGRPASRRVQLEEHVRLVGQGAYSYERPFAQRVGHELRAAKRAYLAARRG